MVAVYAYSNTLNFDLVSTEVFSFLTRFFHTPALHIAAAEGRLDLVKSLLKLKADATLKDKLGNTPLKDAVLAKCDRVAALIRCETPGIKYTMPGNELGGFMCEAAFDGDLDQIKRLMANGVGPNESNYDKRTALMTASCEGHIPVVTYLLEHGADIDVKDRFGGTARKYVCVCVSVCVSVRPFACIGLFWLICQSLNGVYFSTVGNSCRCRAPLV